MVREPRPAIVAGLGRVLKGISLYTLFMLVIYTLLVHDIDIIEVFTTW